MSVKSMPMWMYMSKKAVPSTPTSIKPSELPSAPVKTVQEKPIYEKSNVSRKLFSEVASVPVPKPVETKVEEVKTKPKTKLVEAKPKTAEIKPKTEIDIDKQFDDAYKVLLDLAIKTDNQKMLKKLLESDETKPNIKIKNGVREFESETDFMDKKNFAEDIKKEETHETNDNKFSEEHETEEHEFEESYEDASGKELTCATDGCDEKFTPTAEEKRCTECRKHKTAYIRPCAEEGCEDKVFMTHQQIKDGKSRFGDEFQPFKRCMTHNKKKIAAKQMPSDSASVGSATSALGSAEQDIVYDFVCKHDECTNHVTLTQSQLDFFQQDHMEMPKFCEPCRKERKISKQKMVECKCAACDDTIKMSEMMKSSLEEKGRMITCEPCRKTNTRNCNHCHKSFFSIAQEAELKAKFGKTFKPPSCCSKVCSEQKTKGK